MTSTPRSYSFASFAFAAVALLLATMECAFAGTVVRDHRGANDTPDGGIVVRGGRVTTTSNPLNCDKKSWRRWGWGWWWRQPPRRRRRGQRGRW